MAGVIEALKGAAKIPGKLGEAAEMAFPNLFHPEMILRKSAQGSKLYDTTVELQRVFRVTGQEMKQRVANIVEKYGINDEATADQFLGLVEFKAYNKRAPTPSELAAFPKNVVEAAAEHLQTVTDPIWKIAKQVNPELNYQPGYFTHFPLRSRKQDLIDELTRVKKSFEAVDGVEGNEAAAMGFKNQLETLTKQYQKMTHADTPLENLRYQRLPNGGYYGPMSEQRKVEEAYGYKRNYQDVMDDYVDGAMRKIFLDKYLPEAKVLVDAEPNLALKSYAFDYVTAQRGGLGAKRRVFLNEALGKIFPDPGEGYSQVARAVDYATRFQYFTKIGMSWFRFPFVNATQPLLTTYPLVGGKNLMKGYMEAFNNPEIWKEAKAVGVTFENDVRRGVTDFLSRGGKLSKIEEKIGYPAQASEKLNRVATYAAGLAKGEEMGLGRKEAVRYAIDLVNRTQFLYHKEALPLIMSASPAGRLIYQFRSFTANYVNLLTGMLREKNYPAFARAMGSLGALAGSAALPFDAWDHIRAGLLRKGGVDIGDGNMWEWGTEKFGISPGINFSGSMEPFNIPGDPSQLLGPTVGPLVDTAFKLQKEPEKAGEILGRFASNQFPPMKHLIQGLGESEVRGNPSANFPQGRVLGERRMAETLFMRPSFEFTRNRYLKLMANAMVGGRMDLVAQFQQRARSQGIHLGPEDIAIARQQASQLKGRKKVEPSLNSPDSNQQGGGYSAVSRGDFSIAPGGTR